MSAYTEKAREVARELALLVADQLCDADHQRGVDAIAAALDARDAAARASERERCAKVCDERMEFYDGAARDARAAKNESKEYYATATGTMAWRLAAAIRALDPPAEGSKQ